MRRTTLHVATDLSERESSDNKDMPVSRPRTEASSRLERSAFRLVSALEVRATAISVWQAPAISKRDGTVRDIILANSTPSGA